MQMQLDEIKKVELPINMISSLGEAKMAKVSDNIINGLKKYYNQDTSDYRSRVKNLYTDLKGINPIDNKINSVLYLKNYLEKGIAIKTSINSIKQTWTEYRLVYNEENMKREVEKMDENFKITDSYVLNNFDDIFDRLSMKVDGVGKYVQDLKDMKEKLDSNSVDMKKERELFRKEKMEFEEYKQLEEKKISQKEKELKEQMEKLESLVKVFDLKVSDIIK